MDPKHKQAASLSGTSSTETLEKEELIKARAIKRAERAEARRVKAEKRKEAVCPHVLSVPPSLKSDVLPLRDKKQKFSQTGFLGKRLLP